MLSAADAVSHNRVTIRTPNLMSCNSLQFCDCHLFTNAAAHIEPLAQSGESAVCRLSCTDLANASQLSAAHSLRLSVLFSIFILITLMMGNPSSFTTHEQERQARSAVTFDTLEHCRHAAS